MGPSAMNPLAADIFISCAQDEDGDRALELADHLEAAGLTVWLAHRSVEGAQNYGPEIVNAIGQCKALVVLCSRASLQSEHVAVEVELAFEAGRPRLPLRLDETAFPDRIRYWLTGSNWIDASGPATEWLPAVIRALERLDAVGEGSRDRDETPRASGGPRAVTGRRAELRNATGADIAEPVTVSVLFTDLVDSTALATRLGPEAAEERRRAHFAMLRETAEAADGEVVKGTGDGVMVVFPSASQAVGCAVRMQQRLAQQNRRTDEPLAMRVGLSAGDAELDEGDYYGPAVTEAARLCNAAKGGQVLATQVVATLTGNRGGHSFSPMGALDLKGLAGPVPTCLVEWEPLPIVGLALQHQLASRPDFGFFGREYERQRITEAYKAATGEGRQLVLVAGEPGIGKTRLASEAAATIHAEGATALYGRCDDEVGAAYQPFAEALRHLVAHLPEAMLAEHLELHGGEVGRLVPELRERLAAPAPQQTDPETEQRLLFSAVAGLLSTASEEDGLVLVLDDLHWADKPSLLLLRYLLDSNRPLRVLLIGTYREADVTPDRPLRDTLAQLHTVDGVHRLALSGLADNELVELMESAAGHELDESGVTLAHSLRDETDGNPFFTVELLRHLAESGTIYEEAGRWRVGTNLAALGLPQSIHEVIASRVDRLGAEALQALTLAAVIGRDFDLELLGMVAAEDSHPLERGRVLDALERSQRAALVAEVAPGRFSFAHALIGHTLYERLGATRRAQTHQQAAQALERLCAGRPQARLPELATHWLAARLPGNEPKALEYSRRAGDQALESLAPDEAVQWYRRALEVLERTGEVETAAACDCQIRLGEAQRRAGAGDFRLTLLDAAALATRLGDTDQLVRAALANTRGAYSRAGETDDARIAVLRDALARVGDAETPARSLLLAQLAAELMYADVSDNQVLSNEALALARRLDDPATLMAVLRLRFDTIRLPDTLAERLENTREHLAIASTSSDPLQHAFAALYRSDACWEAGDADEAKRRLDEAWPFATKIGDPYLEWSARQRRAFVGILEGRFEEAEEESNRAFAVAAGAGQPDAVPVFAAHLLELRRHQGRLAEIEPLLAQTVAENPGIPGFRVALALTYCELDRLDEAATLFERDANTDFRALPYDAIWMGAMSYLAEVCAQLGHRVAAARLYERLRPWGDQVVFSGAAVTGSVQRYLGILAATAGRLDDADAHLASALDVNDRLGAVVYVARTRLDWARVLATRQARSDPGRARELADAALRSARELGLATVERRAAALDEELRRG
jgi:class 3 adenylate cyclase/tetratricopeptide (TPR) repeat protein